MEMEGCIMQQKTSLIFILAAGELFPEAE